MPLVPCAPVPLDVIAKAPELIDEVGQRFFFLIVDETAFEASTEVTSTLSGVGRHASLATTPRLIVFPIDGSRRVTLGSDVVIRHSRVSGAHAAIAADDASQWWLIDLASSNGTFVDSRCLAPGEAARAPLRQGAVRTRCDSHAHDRGARCCAAARLLTRTGSSACNLGVDSAFVCDSQTPALDNGSRRAVLHNADRFAWCEASEQTGLA